MAHAVGSSLSSFFLARIALGFGESGIFPASIKAVAEWFPAKERALATGIFNAGTNVGVILAGLSVPWITHHFGWRWAFVIIGSLGFAWLALWLLLYQKPEDHPRCSKAELEYIQGDTPQPTEKITAAVSADVGNCLRKIPDRPDLVVLSFLGARFSGAPARGAPGATGSSDHRDLCDFRYWQRCRRVVLVFLDPAGSFRKRGAQDCHARVCNQHRSHRVCLPRVRIVAGSPVDWSRCCGASRVLCKSLYFDFGFVSETSSGLRHGDSRNGGRSWGMAYGMGGRA